MRDAAGVAPAPEPDAVQAGVRDLAVFERNARGVVHLDDGGDADGGLAVALALRLAACSRRKRTSGPGT